MDQADEQVGLNVLAVADPRGELGALDVALVPSISAVLGTQIRPSCCSGVFVDQSAESIAAAELVWRAWTDEA
jgi:hypothetical protein